MRMVLRIAYDGSDFRGWQRNPQLRTVQGAIEEALESLGLRPQAASRTDTRVHAAGQVVRLDLDEEVPDLRQKLNAVLPIDVVVRDAVPAPPRFNARWSSRGKGYSYLISVPADRAAAFADPFLSARTWILPDPRSFPDEPEDARPDEAAMAAAGQTLLGERDFRGLATVRTRLRRRDGIRRLGAVRLVGTDYTGAAGGRLLWLAISGSAFPKHQVRNLAGLLAQVGFGQLEAEQLPALVAQRRRHEGPRAPGWGLTLGRVRYPRPLDPFA